MSNMRNFEQLQKLGDGAFSTVFKVRRRTDNELYALKKVKIQTLKPKEKENAVNEVRILASINHPNLIELKEAFLDDTTSNLCLVMEYADGGDLLKKISNAQKIRKNFPEEEVWKIFIDMVQGLKSLHDRKILHRDLKCANIFLMQDGTAKLGDLNVSKIAEKGMVYTQTGTPYYASPEVWKDKPYDSKSDIWSLGAVLYEVAALKPPFTANDMQGLYKKVVNGVYPPIPNTYSDDLSTVIKAMLQVNPNVRPNCDRILAMPQVKRYMSNIQTENSIAGNESTDLLKTIKVPRNINLLKDNLPVANYEKRSPGSRRSTQEGRPVVPRFRGALSEDPSVLTKGPASEATPRNNIPAPPSYARNDQNMPPRQPRIIRPSPLSNHSRQYSQESSRYRYGANPSAVPPSRNNYPGQQGPPSRVSDLHEQYRKPLDEQSYASRSPGLPPSAASNRYSNRGQNQIPMPRYPSNPGLPLSNQRRPPSYAARPSVSKLPQYPAYNGPQITVHDKDATGASKMQQIREQYNRVNPSIYNQQNTNSRQGTVATPAWWG